MTDRGFSEEELSRLEAEGTAASVPDLVRAIRDYQRSIESLRLSMDVALRDRDELRAALLRCQDELRRRKGD